MASTDKIYTCLVALFSIILVLGNLTYQKFVSLPLLGSLQLELSVGTLLYPLTFLVTDLVTEFYGKEKANFCIYLAIAMNIFIALILAAMDFLEATTWSKVDGETFHNVFGLFNVAFIGSMIACYVSQRTDVLVYLWIRKLTGERWLWLRNSMSTAIALLIDTTIMISFMVFFGIISQDLMGLLITNSYLYKLFFTICSVPLFYMGFWVIKILTFSSQIRIVPDRELIW